MKKIRVGILRRNYNWERNIYGTEKEAVRYVRVVDSNTVLQRAVGRMSRLSPTFKSLSLPLEDMHIAPHFPSVDLFHYWGYVSLGKKPWVVSTSKGLPIQFAYRNARYFERVMTALASESCKHIILTSEYAKEDQFRKIRALLPAAEDNMAQKMRVLPPPQTLYINDWSDKEILLKDDAITLSLVGHDFFRKGGKEIVRVVNKLTREGLPLRLNIVSTLSKGRIIRASDEELEEVKAVIHANPSICHYERLTNEEVLRLFMQSHVGLLPSYVETYGYTVLEAQACGCATITTDIFAFPEINPDATGWKISLKEDYDYTTQEGRALISHRITQGLEKILREIAENPGLLRSKGEAAVHRIRDTHNVQKHSATLVEVYKQALGRA